MQSWRYEQGRGAAAGWSPVIQVRGEAVAEADPETARFVVGVEERAKGHWETSDSISRRSNELLALISAYGPAIEKAKTGRLWVSPEPHAARDRVRWYRGVIRTRFSVRDFSVLSELVGRIRDLQPVALTGPDWELSPDSPVCRETLASAVHAARSRAALCAEAIGARLTGLVELADANLTVTGRPGPATAGAGRPAVDLEPVPQDLHASVDAWFTMTQPASMDAPAG